MDITDYTIKHLILSNWSDSPSPELFTKSSFDILKPIREYLNRLEINDAEFAHHICRLIPANCPFARKISLFGKTLVTIPPLCKINPFYEELMLLRFRALSYLADDCGEDISAYC